MDLSYYNDQVDQILWDAVGNDSFLESEFDDIVNHIADTIYQYHTTLSKPNLKIIVSYIVELKHVKHYVYDIDADINKTTYISKSSRPSKSKSSDKKIKYDPESESDTELVLGINTVQESDDESDTMMVTMSDIEYSDEETPKDDALVPSNYLNSEIKSKMVNKVQFASSTDLISHRHDYPHSGYQEEIYQRRKKRIVEIKKIPQHEQKSQQWLDQRNECLTATAVATALDEDPYKHPAELLLDKCGRGAPFVENEHVHHGKKYEEIVSMFYSFRNNIVMAEYGLLQHDVHTFIGASPDGICEKYAKDSKKLSKLVGRLLEIKCPNIRRIILEGDLDGDIIPHYYYVQVLTQLFVTRMDECDFIQCKIEEYDTWGDFVSDCDSRISGLSKKTNLEKGVLIQLAPKDMIGPQADPKMCLYNSRYLYPPRLHMSLDETKEWISDQTLQFHKNELSEKYLIDRVIFWRLAQATCNLVKSNNSWFESIIPQLRQFWDYVLFYREHEKKLNRLVKYIEQVGVDKSAEIFMRIHQDYISVHTNSNYQPLYQTESAWRIKYNKKYAKYSKSKFSFKAKK